MKRDFAAGLGLLRTRASQPAKASFQMVESTVRPNPAVASQPTAELKIERASQPVTATAAPVVKAVADVDFRRSRWSPSPPISEESVDTDFHEADPTEAREEDGVEVSAESERRRPLGNEVRNLQPENAQEEMPKAAEKITWNVSADAASDAGEKNLEEEMTRQTEASTSMDFDWEPEVARANSVTRLAGRRPSKFELPHLIEGQIRCRHPNRRPRRSGLVPSAEESFNLGLPTDLLGDESASWSSSPAPEATSFRSRGGFRCNSGRSPRLERQ